MTTGRKATSSKQAKGVVRGTATAATGRTKGAAASVKPASTMTAAGPGQLMTETLKPTAERLKTCMDTLQQVNEQAVYLRDLAHEGVIPAMSEEGQKAVGELLGLMAKEVFCVRFLLERMHADLTR